MSLQKNAYLLKKRKEEEERKKRSTNVSFCLLTLKLGLYLDVGIALITCINNSQWKVLTRIVRKKCACVCVVVVVVGGVQEVT